MDPVTLYGIVIVGTIITVSLGGFAIMGGFKAATFGKFILSTVLATAGGGVGGDQIATNLLDLERPSAIQDFVEDIDLEEPCSWERDIKGTWAPDYLDSSSSVFEINNKSYLKFKSGRNFTLKIAADFYNDVTFSGRYACGSRDRLKLMGEIDKKTVRELMGSDVPNVPLNFTIEYDVEIDGDNLKLTLKDAYFSGLGTFLSKSGSLENKRQEGYGCDLTDVNCWNASIYYIMKENIPYITFEKD